MNVGWQHPEDSRVGNLLIQITCLLLVAPTRYNPEFQQTKRMAVKQCLTSEQDLLQDSAGRKTTGRTRYDYHRSL